MKFIRKWLCMYQEWSDLFQGLRAVSEALVNAGYSTTELHEIARIIQEGRS